MLKPDEVGVLIYSAVYENGRVKVRDYRKKHEKKISSQGEGE